MTRRGSPSCSTYENVRPSGHDPRRARRERAVDHAVGRQDAGQEHLRDHLDDARAAHARDRRRVEAGLVGPAVVADHGEARLERLLVDADAFDRTGRGSLATADLRSLERRPRRAGRGEHPVAVAEHDLRVRPDVDDQVHGLLLVRRLGQDHARGVRADVSGDARQQVHARPGVDVQVDVGRPAVDGPVRGQRERRAAQLGRVDAQEQVMHDRVADDRQRQDVGRTSASTCTHRSAISSSTHARTTSVSCVSAPGFIIT